MTTRTPLVVVNGQTQQMPTGDAVPLTHGGTGATTAGDALTALGGVPTARTLTMTAPLTITGGGTLSADRTLGLSYDTTLQVVGGALGVSSLVALASHTHSQYVTSAGSVAYATNAGSVTNGAYTNVANTFTASQIISGSNTLMIGPNTTWARSLRLGGNGNSGNDEATVCTTNGNLHLDSKAGRGTYLNLYSMEPVYVGTAGNTANVVLHENNYETYGVRRISRPYAAIANTAAGQSIPASTSTLIDFGTVESDVESAITTGASWRWTAPITAMYRVSVFLTFASVAWSGELMELDVYRNGTAYKLLDVRYHTGTVNAFVAGTALLNMTAGQYVDVRLFHMSASAKTLLASAVHNSFQIEVA